VWMPQQLRQQY
jgi:hypothetical protein